MLWLVGFGFVVIFALVLVAVSMGMKFQEVRRKQQVTGMLQTVAGPTVVTTTKLLKDLEPEEPPLVQRLLVSLNLLDHAQQLIRHAGLDWNASRLFGAMGVTGAIGIVLGLLLPDILGKAVNCLVLGPLFATFPYLYVRKKRSKRFALLEEQLPEALDFLARSMRAGHAFTISLELLGEELDDPLGQEFRTFFNEQNLGATLEVAMSNLCERVPTLDVRFFASTVMLQRQTGGNLSEVLNRLSYVIRERFRLKGQVKAMSAHGRITASVLTALPILTMIGLMVLSPGYLKGMAKDSDGRLLIGGAVLAQLAGNFCIKRIVNIKV